MTFPDYQPLFYWVREREQIRRRKDMDLDQASWTLDPILATYRFCNVRREDDRVTVWVREHIREPFAGHPQLWLMLCIARQINWPPTLDSLVNGFGSWPDQEGFDLKCLVAQLQARKSSGEKIYTGAYMISAPADKGADKQLYIGDVVIGDLWRRRDIFAKHFARQPSLQRTHELIMRSNGWGPFMAYQAVVDMRFTGLLRHAGDALSWAAAGPGTLRGLNRLYGRDIKFALSQAQALKEMRAIYEIVESATGVAMDFSDVPNILCETDKYLRVKNGEGKPRALYVAGRGY
jgi:alpha-glutamyl/putrescinyl thymine pyrophosphorylase clade 1